MDEKDKPVVVGLTEAQIRARFIEDNAEFLLSELNTVLRGEGDFSSKSNVWLGAAFERIFKMVDQAGDLRILKAKSGTDIVEAMEKGEMTSEEALKYLEVIKARADAEGGGDTDNSPPITNFVFPEGFKQDKDGELKPKQEDK